MAENKVGCLLVVNHPNGQAWDQDAGDIVGIVSERDYLTKVALVGRKSDTTRVAEIMTPSSKIKTVSPHHNVVDAMVLMTSHNIRHLPVIDKGNYMGMVSIRDVVETVVKNAKASATPHWLLELQMGNGRESAAISRRLSSVPCPQRDVESMAGYISGSY